MRIDSCSQLSFGNVRNSLCDDAGEALMRRIGKGGKNISRFSAMLSEQEANPVGIEFYFKNGENPNKSRFRAELSIDTPYFKGFKQYRQWLFMSPMKFFERMCKKADKMNEERSYAEQRYEMFERKNSIGCGKNSSINALEE